jgi:transcriptional regulator with XRE-family HTH domain
MSQPVTTTTTGQPRLTSGRVAAELQRLRKVAGLTQIEAAEQCAVSLAFIRNVEQGHVPRRSPTLERVFNLLNDAGPAGNGAGVQESPTKAATSGTG